MPAYTERERRRLRRDRRSIASTARAQAAQARRGRGAVRSVTAHCLRTPHTGAHGLRRRRRRRSRRRRSPSRTRSCSTASPRSGPVTVHLHARGRRCCPTCRVRERDRRAARQGQARRGRRDRRPPRLVGRRAGRARRRRRHRHDDAGAARCCRSSASRRAARSASCCSRTRRTALRGGKAYAEDHAAELANTVLALETDSGGFAPRGFAIDAQGSRRRSARVDARIAEIASLLAPLGATRVTATGARRRRRRRRWRRRRRRGSGSDVDGRHVLRLSTTPTPTRSTRSTRRQLADDVAAVAVLAYVVADMPGRLSTHRDVVARARARGAARARAARAGDARDARDARRDRRARRAAAPTTR